MNEGNGLPQGWCWTTVADLAAAARNAITDGPFGSNLKTEHYRSEGMRVVRLQNIGDGVFRDDRAYIDPGHFAKLSKFQVMAGDIVIAALGDNPPRSCIVPEFVGPAIVKADCVRFQVSPWVSNAYVNWALNSPPTRKRAGSLIHGVGRPRLNLSEIRSIAIPLAPLAEQRRIVAAIEQQFSRLDAGVAALRRVQAALKRYRAAVLRAAVEGKLTQAWRAEHPDAEPASALLARILADRRARWEADLRAKGKDPARARYEEPTAPDAAGLSELPEGWCWATLVQFADAMGGVTKGRELSNRVTVSLPYLRVANVQRGFLDLREVKAIEVPCDEVERYLLRQGDVVLTEGGDADKLGRAALWQSQVDRCVHQNHVFRARIVTQEISPAWFVFCANSEQGRAYFLEASKQTVNLASINLAQLRNCPVPLPPPAEQEQIVAEVERRLSVVSELEAAVEASLKRAERLRQSILERAFSGRLVPQDPNDEPASVLLERIRSEREERAADGPGRRNGRRRGMAAASMAEPVAARRSGLWGEAQGGGE